VYLLYFLKTEGSDKFCSNKLKSYVIRYTKSIEHAHNADIDPIKEKLESLCPQLGVKEDGTSRSEDSQPLAVSSKALQAPLLLGLDSVIVGIGSSSQLEATTVIARDAGRKAETLSRDTILDIMRSLEVK
tara:strand:- start:484 stop:873 length:390 start_codon:yes stop_codon:yes gene_type:complete